MDRQDSSRGVDAGARPAPWTIGPLGQKFTRNMMPPATTRRWTPLQKAEVVAGVRGKLLTLDEALVDYGLSVEEFAAWERAVARFGMRGLRSTQVQTYRAIEAKDRRAAALAGRGPGTA